MIRLNEPREFFVAKADCLEENGGLHLNHAQWISKIVAYDRDQVVARAYLFVQERKRKRAFYGCGFGPSRHPSAAPNRLWLIPVRPAS
jgi:hypothetical protein